MLGAGVCKRVLLFLALLFCYVKGQTIEIKEAAIQKADLIRAINAAQFRFTIHPRELAKLDISKSLTNFYHSSFKREFYAGFKHNDNPDTFIFYLPKSKTIKDYLSYAFNGRLGDKLESDLSQQIKMLIQCTERYCLEVVTDENGIDCAFSFVELVRIFSEKLQFQSGTLQLNEGQKMSDDDLKQNGLLQYACCYDIAVAFIPADESVQVFVERCASTLKGPGINHDKLLDAVEKRLMARNDPNSQRVQWIEMLRELRSYSPANDGVARTPEASNNFQILRVDDDNLAFKLCQKLYREFGRLVVKRTGITREETMCDFFFGCAVCKQSFPSATVAMSSVIKNCNYGYRTSFNAAVVPNHLETKEITVVQLNQAIKNALIISLQYLELRILNDDMLQGGIFKVTSNSIKCPAFPFIKESYTSDFDLYVDYISFIKREIVTTQTRKGVIIQFFDLFKSNDMMIKYTQHLESAIGQGLKLNQSLPSSKSLTTDKNSQPAGGKTSKRKSSQTPNKQGSAALAYGLIFGIPVGLLFIGIPLYLWVMKRYSRHQPSSL